MSDYWFPYTTIIINVLIIWFMPRNLTQREIYHAWWTLAALTVYTDLLFGDVMDLYDFGPKGIQFVELPIEALLPPSFGILFLNFFPQTKRWGILYLIGWTAFSVLYEWLAILSGFEKLKGWTLWYSAPVYLLVFLFLKWHFHYVRSN